MPWVDFVEVLKQNLGVDYDSIAELKYLLGGITCLAVSLTHRKESGRVDKSLWDYFLKWFTPLHPNGVEIDKSKGQPAYFFKDILEVISPPYVLHIHLCDAC